MSPAPRGQNAKKIALRYLFFTLGLLINSFGISIEIAPDVITVPSEGLVRVLAQATGKDFGRVKLVFDDEVLDYIVDKAIEYRLGARGLRSICEAIMMDTMFDIPSSGCKEFRVTLPYAKEKIEKANFVELKKVG